MKIENLSPGGLAANCYLVSKGRDAVLIDPTATVIRVRSALQEKGLALHAILLTHGHFDHILTAEKLRDELGAPLLVHEADNEMLNNGEKNASFPFFGRDICCRPAERLLKNRESLTFGSLSFSVMHTPGHTKGSVIYFTEGAAFTGDTLFADGYGRTDLYGGDTADMYRSLKDLAGLQEDIRIYPGHGEDTQLFRAISFLKKQY